MRAKFVIFFMLLTGLSFAIVKGANDSQQKGFADISNSRSYVCENCSKNILDLVWTRLQNTVGVMSGPYLLKKLGELVGEHPMKSMVFAIVIGIITNENKENIIEGIKKLRNSAYRVMGFGLKTNEESKKDAQKKEVKFVEWTGLNTDHAPGFG